MCLKVIFYGGIDMDRLTGKDIKLGFVDSNTLPSYTSLYERLRKYENMEEHGSILKLPCAIGDTVYVIAECGNISPQLDGTLYSANGSPGTATGYYCPYEDSCPHDCEEFTDCEDYKKKKTVFKDTVSQITYDGFGITVYTMNCGVCGYVGHEHIFLTREEAEQALKELNM